MKWAALDALVLLLCATFPAFAETDSVSYSVWQKAGDIIYLRFIMPTDEARHLVGPGSPIPPSDVVARYVAGHVAVRSGAKNCPAIDQGEGIGQIDTLSFLPGFYRFEIVFKCPQASDIVLQNSILVDRVSDHFDFARVQMDGGGFVQQLFSSDRQSFRLPSEAVTLSDAGPAHYFEVGLRHILSAPERLVFIFGLLLVARRWHSLIFVTIGVASGYLLSIGGALTGMIALRPALVEPLISLMALMIAADAVARATRRPAAPALALFIGSAMMSAAMFFMQRPSAGLVLFGGAFFATGFVASSPASADRRFSLLLPALLFGWLDGFALADKLLPLHLPTLQSLPIFTGMDMAAFATATALLLVPWALAALPQGRGFNILRPAAVDLGAAALAGLGAFQCVKSIFG